MIGLTWTLIVLVPLTYAVAFALQVAHFWKGQRRTRTAALAALVVGGALHLGLLSCLGALHGHMPLTSVWEAFSTIAFVLVPINLYLQLRSGTANVGVFLVGAVVLFQGVASIRLEPALVHNDVLEGIWFGAHAVASIGGYTSFAVSGVLAALYLLQRRQIRSRNLGFFHSRLPALGVLDQMVFQSAVIGLVLLSVGVICGAVFAQQVWGEPWSWDPKQVSAALVWLVFLAGLVLRLAAGWKGGRSALLCLLGVATMIFTLIGVPLLFESLHEFI